ncbi:unnamed protein product [Fraxinus pennsylvanica]|uniref:Uncharacterized protein n=1 Tax=Fraxinus pennsylvanica TaxID=56036 RepID=A0AAD2DKP9_9LAMI|nr:unnamed protein product [Fraxinus pennsylvanica]
MGISPSKPYFEIGVISGIEKRRKAPLYTVNMANFAFAVKFGGLAKLYFNERRPDLLPDTRQPDEELNKVEYHNCPPNTCCTGAAFVGRPGSPEEDGGWIITYIHNEEYNVSQVWNQRPLEDAPSYKICHSIGTDRKIQRQKQRIKYKEP